VDDPARAGPLTGGDPDRVGTTAMDPGPDALAIPPDLDATIVLVRHGESELIVQHRFQGQAESPLSAIGRRQAALVAARLARPHARPALPIPSGPPLAIVHSPLGRAVETASAIHAAAVHRGAFGGPIAARGDPRFLEIGQGAWEGRLSAEIAAADGERLAAWRRTPTLAWAPGGERLDDVRARVAPGLTDLLTKLAAADRPGSIASPQVAGYRDPVPDHPWAILVGHDGVFKIVLLTLFGLELERFWMWSMDLCAITVVEFRAGRAVLRAHNLTAHLAELDVDREAAAHRAQAEERERSGAQ